MTCHIECVLQLERSFIVAHQLNKFISFAFGHHKTLMVYILDFWIDYQNSYKTVHHIMLLSTGSRTAF